MSSRAYPSVAFSRLSALVETGLLDSPPEPAFDRLTDLVRRVLGVPVSLVSLVDRERQFFKSQQGLDEPWCSLRETPLSHSFCQHVVERDKPLVLDDVRASALGEGNLAIRDLGVIAYLGVPIRTPDGVSIGSLCAIDSQPRDWTDRDLEVLRALGDAVTNEIAVRHHLRERVEAETALREANQGLEARVRQRTRQVRRLVQALTLAEESERRRIAEILHDDLQQVLFGAQMQAAAGDGAATARLLTEAVAKTRALAHELHPPGPPSGALPVLIEQIAERVRSLHGLDVDVEVREGAGVRGEGGRTVLAGVLRELLFNVVKHAGTDAARVTAEPVERGGRAFVRVTVADEGGGVDADAAGGSGLASIRDRVGLVGGRLTVDSAPGAGTRVVVEVPAGRDASP